MNILKSILLSSTLITTAFGVDEKRPSSQEETASHEFSNMRLDSKSGALPGEVWAMMYAMLSTNLSAGPSSSASLAKQLSPAEIVAVLSQTQGLCTDPSATQKVMQDRETLQKNWANIVALLICSNTPVHKVMKANGFDDPRYIMSTIGIIEDVDEADDRVVSGHYEHTDRKEIAAKLMRYAEKVTTTAENIITAADITSGKQVKDGDLVVLSYNDMVTHKAALDGKDIHLCVDVHADDNGQLVWDNDNLPCSLKKLYFQNTQKDVISIGGCFLNGRCFLTHVDLSAFTNVASIGNYFLYGSSGLPHVDLSAFTNVTRIGDFFLSGCAGLTHVDLSPLAKMTSIKNNFLSNCTRLIQVDLSPLSNVKSIGDWFLYKSKLTDVDLSAFTNVESIGDNFLCFCPELTQLNLSGFTNLKSIGCCFLGYCKNLTHVDLSAFTSLVSIGGSFLHKGDSHLLSQTDDFPYYNCRNFEEIKILKGQKDLIESHIDKNQRCRIVVVD